MTSRPSSARVAIPRSCCCQRYKMQRGESWTSVGAASSPSAFGRRPVRASGRRHTSGLVAYLDGEPVGWCAVEPRNAYPRLLLKTRVPWEGRDRGQERRRRLGRHLLRHANGFRRRGISRALARAAVDFARERGARALEGYPMITTPGQEFMPGELHVGSRSAFADAGFTEVSHPTLRRVVMRIDF